VAAILVKEDCRINSSVSDIISFSYLETQHEDDADADADDGGEQRRHRRGKTYVLCFSACVAFFSSSFFASAASLELNAGLAATAAAKDVTRATRVLGMFAGGGGGGGACRVRADLIVVI
jgi:hypothetical protein